MTEIELTRDDREAIWGLGEKLPEAKAYWESWEKAKNQLLVVRAFVKTPEYNLPKESRERKAAVKALLSTPEYKAFKKALLSTPEYKAFKKALLKAFKKARK